MDTILSKVCTGLCGLEKPLDQFNKNRDGKFGRYSQCKVCQSLYKKSYDEVNRDRKSAEGRIWYQNNRELKLEQSRLWAKNNPDKKREATYRRKARLAASPNSMPTNYWNILLGFYGAKCAQCGSTENLTHDHVIPISWDGSEHSLRNSQILCDTHNYSKQDRNSDDYRDWSVGILAERIVT